MYSKFGNIWMYAYIGDKDRMGISIISVFVFEIDMLDRSLGSCEVSRLFPTPGWGWDIDKRQIGILLGSQARPKNLPSGKLT